jgi:transcription initiation factor TFIIH subunit 2
LGFVVAVAVAVAVAVKDGEAEILLPLSSNAKTHKLALQALAGGQSAMGGEFSLQNGLQVAGRSLGHQPRHGSRKIVVLTAALSTCNPGFILTETLPKLQQAHIQVSCFTLVAKLHVCHRIANEMHGIMAVCLDKAHSCNWLSSQNVLPPAVKATLLMCKMVPMGFPTRIMSDVPELAHATQGNTILA